MVGMRPTFLLRFSWYEDDVLSPLELKPWLQRHADEISEAAA
jgi:hypothetical protein